MSRTRARPHLAFHARIRNARSTTATRVASSTRGARRGRGGVLGTVNRTRVGGSSPAVTLLAAGRCWGRDDPAAVAVSLPLSPSFSLSRIRWRSSGGSCCWEACCSSQAPRTTMEHWPTRTSRWQTRRISWPRHSAPTAGCSASRYSLSTSPRCDGSGAALSACCREPRAWDGLVPAIWEPRVSAPLFRLDTM